MLRLFSLVRKVAGTDSTVLVTGENGTGKELVARALHFSSNRRDADFVAQNVSAFNDNLLESELFGHIEGAFTGAVRDKKGLFKVADGGTLFLDEIGDMSTGMQVKLLRVLQKGEFTPVGGLDSERVDVRIIVATNRDLESMVRKGSFREDLYYRLNVLRVVVPPLRDRKEDIPLLVEHFLDLHADRGGGPRKRLSPGVMASLLSRSWQGNVRELENEIERLLVLAGEDEEIGVDLLEPVAPDGAPRSYRETGDLASAVAALERDMIAEGLAACGGNKTKLAMRLGISRTTLLKKIKAYGL